MQISLLLICVPFLFSTNLGFDPSPAPEHVDGSAHPPFSPLAPESSSDGWSGSGRSPPAPAKEVSESSGEVAPTIDEAAGVGTVRWCSVKEEYDGCRLLVHAMEKSDGYKWECINKETTQQCLESIKKGESDLIILEAGLAYTAFINYSMKAIANEVYCDRARSYAAVAVVNRKACTENKRINLKDFKGKKSCHGSYSSAAGWNYPINHIKESFDGYVNLNDSAIAMSFFSKVCAPLDFQGEGNGFCSLNGAYWGDLGAFRCLVEEVGDIAFVRGDTALLYSAEGPHNQSWSSKSVRDFMYLCPQGGCREINGYPGSCSFGAVPANVIMASNSIPQKKKLLLLQVLTNATLMDALHSKQYAAIGVFTPGTQELSVVKKLTRSYLGKSALISQSIKELNNPIAEKNPPAANSVSDASSQMPCTRHSLIALAMTMVLWYRQ